jgi:D-sedoheptulose 7-phosphate isomerase
LLAIGGSGSGPHEKSCSMNSADIARRLLESAALKERVARELSGEIERAGQAVVGGLSSGGKLIFFGNGGSAADAQHLAAELVGRYVAERAPLPAIALTTDSSALTAIGNDYGFEQVFVRQIRALGRRGDVAIAISTSGRSRNVILGIEAAREAGLTTIALTGGDGGNLLPIVDVAIVVPSTTTARIQECHITIGHVLCEYVDGELLGKDGGPDNPHPEARIP